MNFLPFFVAYVVSFAGKGEARHDTENNLAYIRSKISGGDFRDLLNSDDEPRWSEFLESEKFIHYMDLLQQELSHSTGLPLASLRSVDSMFEYMDRVYAFIFDIAAYYVSETRNADDSQERNELIRKIVLFADNPPSFCNYVHWNCLGWTAQVKYENRYVQGVTIWTAIMFVLASRDPSEDGYHSSLYVNRAAEVGMAFVRRMRGSLISKPAKAEKFVCLLESTPIAVLKNSIRAIEAWLADRGIPDWLPGISDSC